jgi:hypothetical protein
MFPTFAKRASSQFKIFSLERGEILNKAMGKELDRDATQVEKEAH